MRFLFSTAFDRWSDSRYFWVYIVVLSAIFNPVTVALVISALVD